MLRRRHPHCLASGFFATLAFVSAGLILGQPEVLASRSVTALAPADGEKVLVVVEGSKLTASEAQRRLNRRVMAMRTQIPPRQLKAMMNRISREIVEEFIAQSLLAKEAEEQAMDVPESEVAKGLAELRGSLPEGTTLEQAMAAQGTDMSEVLSNIRRDYIIRQLIERNLPSSIEVTDTQVADFYKHNIERMTVPETVHARHILVAVPAESDRQRRKQALQTAKSVRKQLQEGADFAALARDYSDCPSAAKGGDLGTFSRGNMVEEFDRAAFSQKVNQIGQVIETKFGYHVIEVLEHEDARIRPLEEVAGTIKEHLEQRKRAEAFTAYVQELREEATIHFPGRESDSSPGEKEVK